MSQLNHSVEYHFLLRSIQQFNFDLKKLSELIKNLPDQQQRKILSELELIKENIGYVEKLF